MSSTKYIGMDVHKESISIAVRNSAGKIVMELVRSYLTISRDLAWVMTRVKAIYRSWAIPCSGKQVYASRHRAESRRRPGPRTPLRFATIPELAALIREHEAKCNASGDPHVNPAQASPDNFNRPV
jgi:hypothetical protein